MIRAFEQHDLDRVLQIWLDASLKAHDFIEASYWQSHVESMRNLYIPASQTYVIERESRVMGFYSLHENQLIDSWGLQGQYRQLCVLSLARLRCAARTDR